MCVCVCVQVLENRRYHKSLQRIHEKYMTMYMYMKNIITLQNSSMTIAPSNRSLCGIL